MLGGNPLGVLVSCQVLLAEFFPNISPVLSFSHPPLQPRDTGFHKMICFVSTSLQAWHLQLQRSGAWRHLHPLSWKRNQGKQEAWRVAIRATEQLN